MTPSEPTFDTASAHRYFSGKCFNRVWELLQKRERTEAEAEEMLRTSYASLWHWAQRADCTDTKWSVGYWQLSRVYALLGQAAAADRYGQLSLKHATATDVPAFFRGYAYEALARAAAVAGNKERTTEYLIASRAAAAQIEREPDRETLIADLQTIVP